MFGGFGFYKNGVIFALIVDGELYFKVDAQTCYNFEELDSHPFVYSRGEGKSTTMPYWTLPESIMEDRDKLSLWVDKAVQASIRSKKKNKNKKKG